MNALRKQSLGDGLIKSFKDSGQSPSREPRTGDVLVKDPRNNVTGFSFDRQGFIGAVKSPLGRTWRLENDQQGRLLGLTNPAGLRLGVEYNAQGDVRSVSRSQRTLFNLNYDKPGRFSQIVYPDQTAAQFQYDTSNLLSAFTSRLNITETYEHNPDGDLVSITDGNNNRTAFEYSLWNRPDHVRYADGSTESYEYDPIGLVRRITAGSEAIAELEHNDAGQPTKISYRDGDIVSFRYDDNNRVIEARNAEITVQYEYDDEGRVIREKQGEQLIEYHYDDSGTLTGLSYPSGEKVEFSYDEDLRLASVADWDKGLHKFSYIEDDGGFILRSPNGLATTVHQSAEGLTRATVVARESSGGQLFSLEYQYDVEDRLTTLRDSEFGTRQYAYDAEGQLLSVSATQAARGEVFAYDRAGNRVRRGSERATFNAINQLKSQGDIQCSYDVRGNQVSCLSPDEVWQYTYNSRNLLIRAEGRNGQVISFGYDAFGRRLWKRSGEIRVSYIWAGEYLVREVKEDGSLSSAQDYLYYPGTYTPLSTRIDGKVYYYHTDHLGTPRRLTDPYGNTVWSADYDAFGEARVKTHLIENPLRFPGQYFDQETGLHYNRFRYYSPILGRYLSRDPVTYLSGLNFYAYASNNP
ncbi:MAG: RHS repeat-associated core domain-containing protein, partial [Pyrinomonadaceae bacterium]